MQLQSGREGERERESNHKPQKLYRDLVKFRVECNQAVNYFFSISRFFTQLTIDCNRLDEDKT